VSTALHALTHHRHKHIFPVFPYYHSLLLDHFQIHRHCQVFQVSGYPVISRVSRWLLT